MLLNVLLDSGYLVKLLNNPHRAGRLITNGHLFILLLIGKALKTSLVISLMIIMNVLIRWWAIRMMSITQCNMSTSCSHYNYQRAPLNCICICCCPCCCWCCCRCCCGKNQLHLIIIPNMFFLLLILDILVIS